MIVYNNLWKLLIDKNLTKTNLREMTGISTSTLAKLSKNQDVSLNVIDKICSVLDCDVNDIMKYVK